ncbi:MAG: hypothetical protein QM610_11210 [Chitinophagaceae bacterium]
METITAYPKSKSQTEALKAFAKALKIKIVEQKDAQSPYDPEFVAKIRESEQQIREGKFTAIRTGDLWK